MAEAILPHDFQLRHTTMDDLQGVTDLLIACDIADYGKPTSARATLEEFTRSYWESPNVDLEKNAWVMLAPNGKYAARVNLGFSPDKPEEMYASPRVHPDYCSLGIGTYLLRLVEQRARALMVAIPQENVCIA